MKKKWAIGGRGSQANYDHKAKLFERVPTPMYYIHALSGVRVKSLQIVLFLCCFMFLVRESETQQRRQNSLEDFEWEEAEDDQQCEMVVKCKPAVKTTSIPSISSRETKNETPPETSTYRVPLKPYGAPFNPMTEGGSVMWQKMGTTPKKSARNGKNSKSTTTTTTRSNKFERDLKGKKANSLLGRRSHKLHKEKYLVSNDVTDGQESSQSDKDTIASTTASSKPVIAFSVSLRTFFGHPNSVEFKPIPFDVIHSNVGDAFDVDKESFVAPVDGTYFFTLTITARRGYEAAVDLVHNYRHVWTIVIDSDQDFYSTSWSPGSNSVILQCQKGDRVFARLHGGRFSNLEGSLRNTFTGFLI